MPRWQRAARGTRGIAQHVPRRSLLRAQDRGSGAGSRVADRSPVSDRCPVTRWLGWVACPCLTGRRSSGSLIAAGLAVASLLAMLFAAPAAQGTTDRRPPVRVVAPGVALTTYVDRRVPIRAYVPLDRSVARRLVGHVLVERSIGERVEGARDGRGGPRHRRRERRLRQPRPASPDSPVRTRRRPHPDIPIPLGDVLDLVRRLDAYRRAHAEREPDRGRHGRDLADRRMEPGPAGSRRAHRQHGARRDDRSAETVHLLSPLDTSRSGRSPGSPGTYTVDRAGCFSSRMQPDDGVVISAVPTTDESTFVRSLSPGEALHIDWSFGWPDVIDAIGGSDVLVKDGQIALRPCSGGSFCGRNPRTSVGLTTDGRIVLVVVDGRQSGSAGMSLLELAALHAAARCGFRHEPGWWRLHDDGGQEPGDELPSPTGSNGPSRRRSSSSPVGRPPSRPPIGGSRGPFPSEGARPRCCPVRAR